jgi:hypothetical protein
MIYLVLGGYTAIGLGGAAFGLRMIWAGGRRR